MKVGLMKYEFLKILPWKGLVREFDLRNVFSEGLYEVTFIECPSYQKSTVFINLVFSVFVVISYGKNRL